MKKLLCNRCGKPAHQGKQTGDHCGQFFDEVKKGMFCSGSIIEWEQDFELFDKVCHPEIYYGNEIFTIVGIRVNELELQGDWSGGTHAVIQRGWFKRDGMILKSRPHYYNVF